MPAPGGVRREISFASLPTQAESTDQLIVAPSHMIAVSSGFDAANVRSVEPIVMKGRTQRADRFGNMSER